MFLVGKGIPDHIRNLPETFLKTPFGQMMKPYIDGMLRGVTQAPSVGPPATADSAPRQNHTQNTYTGIPNGAPSTAKGGKVHNVTTLREVENLLASAESSCAIIFFTSSTCPPCKLVYPAYDELAEEAGNKAILIKVDIGCAFEVSSKYGITATPTFITFLKGQKDQQWSGANESQLRGNVRLLIEMAWPLHPHRKLRLQSLQYPINTYITYGKLPPIDKLLQKLGSAGEDPSLRTIISFIKLMDDKNSAKPGLPDLRQLAQFVDNKFRSLPEEIHFAIIDLFRAAFTDPRVSGFFAEETDQKTLMALLSKTNDLSGCSYSHKLVMAQLACNLFTSTIYPERLLSIGPLHDACIQLATHSLLDSHGSLRAAAVSLIYNIAAFNHNERMEERPDRLSESIQVEFVASLLEGIRVETENMDFLRGLLLSLGLLVYLAPLDGEVVDLCRAMDAATLVNEKLSMNPFSKEPLIKEIGQELLGKGLANP